MAEYTCSVCSVKFNEEEKEITKDEHKCILHCDKKGIYSASLVKKKFEEQLKIKYSNPINKFENIIFPEINNIFDQVFNEISFKDCTFYGIQILNDLHHNVDVSLFDHCVFYNHISFQHIHFKSNIFDKCRFPSLKECTIYDSTFEKQLFYKNLYNNYPSNINLIDCKFTKERFIITKPNTIINTIKIDHCQFNRNFEISECSYIKNMTISNSLFNKNFQLMEITIEDMSLLFSSIKGYGLITNSVIMAIDIFGVNFNEFTNFQYSKFKSVLNLSNVHFSKQSSFYNTIVEKSINLENTTFNNEVNFIDISSKQRIMDEDKKFIGYSTPVNVSNRETARKIKDSFEKQNNIIEANKYYGIEMQKRKEELEIKNNFFDWLVFKVHEVTSNNSQDWLLTLLWIINIGLIASIFNFYTMQDENLNYIHSNLDSLKTSVYLIIATLISAYCLTYNNKIFQMVLFTGFYWIYTFITRDSYLTEFANVINPFSIMTKGDTLNLGMLIFKVIIAYLIYQFVVSIRQNTRRK